MSLKSMIVPKQSAKLEFPGCPGFNVELVHLTRDELRKIRDKATTTKVSRKTRQMEEEVDNELFQTLYIQAIIKDWEGAKYKYLAKLVPLDLGELNEEDEEPFSLESAELLMKNAPDFDNWVTNTLEDIENFTSSSSN